MRQKKTKNLIQSTPEEEIVQFPLKLSSSCVANKRNQIILKYLEDLTLNAHLIKYDKCFKRKLRLPSPTFVDWKLRNSIVDKVPKHLHL